VWCAKLAQLAHSKSTSARFVAFALLTRTAATAQHGFLLARLALWLDLALAATSPDAEPVAHVRAMAALAAATLCARASRWSDSRRLVSLHHAAGANPTGRALAAVVNVLDLDVGLDDELFAYWSLALSVLLRAAPAAARALADRIERALLRALVAPHSAVKRRSAAACLALLPASASTRGAAASHADEVVTAHAASAIGDAYATLALRLVALAHDTLDVAFAAVVEPAESDALRVEPSAVGVGRALLGALPDESGAAADALALRFAALCDALSLLFRVEPPSDVPSRRRLPLRAVVALALRVLAVGAVITRNMRVRRGVNQLDGVPLLSRQDVGAALPSLHGAALTLLDALVQAVGTRMLSYADVVGDATLTALARSATPRASVAANAAMSIDAIAVGTGATDGAEFYNDEAAKAALLHAPTRPLAYALASRLLQLGGAGLEDRAFLAPLLAHATCDVKPLADDVVSASDGGAASSKKRKRAKQRGAAADGDAKTSSIEVSLRDLVSERARRAAMRVLHDALLHAPLALSNAVKRACAQAVIDVAARDMLAPQVQQSVATSENTVSALVSRARAEAASMRLIVVQTLDVVLRRVPAAAPASTELLRRLAQDPTEAVSMAARAALLREVHVESTIIKVAESAISVSTRANIEETAEDNDANDVADDNDDDDDDDDDAVEDDDDGVVQQVADDFVEHVEDEPEYSRKDEPAEEAPYEEPVNFEAVEPEDDVVAMATLTTTTTTTTTTVALTVDDADADEPILKRNRTEATAVVTRTYSANGDDDSDSISLPDIVVASPDEADLL
jgi:hypothetical protein